MRKIQIITAPNGDEMVVLPRADYEELAAAAEDAEEDAADLAFYDARKTKLSDGGDHRLPREVSAAILRGDSLLKALRKWRDMTQQELSRDAGLRKGYISDLESGRRKGTEETLKQIAQALDVDENWLTA
jgi:DNA-binding XRE family transcriptional regulator